LQVTTVADGKYAEDGCKDTLENAQVFVPVVTRSAVVNNRYGQLEDEQRRRLKSPPQKQQHHKTILRNEQISATNKNLLHLLY